jgi:uncharacterized LabA/DUF88 family protein
MTQQTMDPGTAPGSQTDDAPSTKTGGRPRRRTASRSRGGAKLVVSATEPQIPAPEATNATDTPSASLPQTSPAIDTASSAETAPTRRPRARRGRSGAGRHEAGQPASTPEPAVGLGAEGRVPAGERHPSGGLAAEPLESPQPEQLAETLRTVPALTPEEWPAPSAEPIRAEPSGTAAPSGEATQPAPTRSYRFRSSTRATAPQPMPVRPERIGGREVLPAERATSEPGIEPPSAASVLPPKGGSATGSGPSVSQLSPELGELIERLGQREPEPALESLPFEAELGGEPAPRAPREGLAADLPSAAESLESLEAGEPQLSEAEPTSGHRRRRRGRRGHGTSAASAPEGTGAERHRETTLYPPAEGPRPLAPTPDPYAGVYGARETENGFVGEYAREEEPFPPYEPGGRERGQEWSVANAQQQIREPRSPFISPDPSYVRGFGPQPSGVAGPARDFVPRQGRTARSDRDVDAPPMSANQLGALFTQAIQRQTDRLLAEMRHEQHPPSMTVMMPAYPSNERVGVFVDVANLIYSARNMRVSLDFGRLLEFLRGNRRLVRAHAYAPTNPDPNADQSFLHAVKGLGYRITTKNYKTFASGAKKADMDLDLCMDIVRLVDAGALETVVLVSGDSDFLPLLEYCSDHGVRVEVAAFDDSAAAILRQSCDLFVNLSLVDGLRA